MPGNLTLARLHRLLQAALGWEAIDLHKFVVGGIEYGPPGLGLGMRSSRAVRLEQVASAATTTTTTTTTTATTTATTATTTSANARFEYWYDIEPGWGHIIVVEEVREVKIPTRPKCLAGARAAPSADCEGVADYLELLTAIHKPRHPRHREAQEWIDWGYDPEECDLKELNSALDRVHQAH